MERNNSYQNNFKDAIRGIANTEINRNMFTDLYVVTKTYTYADKENTSDKEIKEFTCDIKQMDGIQTFARVPIVSQGLGNGKGLMITPSKDDVVVVIFYGQTNSPLIIGSIFNSFMSGGRYKQGEDGTPILEETGRDDDILDVGENEWVLLNKLNGAYIYVNSNNEILIKNTETESYNISGTDYTESFMLFKADGNIEIQCKGGKGNLSP